MFLLLHPKLLILITMKKTLLFAFAMLFATAVMAQNRAVIFEETFDGSTLPSGWSAAGVGTSNWRISATNNAGGEANELHLSWSPQFNGLTRFVSPVIDMTGFDSNVAISFKHCLDNYSGSHPLGIATTTDGGSTWNQAWTHNYSADGAYTVTTLLNTADVGNSNFQFCITFSGDSYNIDNWYFDDFKIFTLENLDVAITGTTMPDIMQNDDLTVNMSIISYGSTPVTSIEATYEIVGMEPVTQTFDVNLTSLGTTTLTFTQHATITNPGGYTVVVTINKVNGIIDDVEENNVLVKTVSVPLDHVQRIPMIEHFSSSTCPPCVNVNVQMNSFCNNNPGRFTYTKYQMNWPSPGDPYYSAEGGVRKTYYGVSGVPSVFLDGTAINGSVSQNIFNQHADEPGYFDVRGSFTVDGNTIHILADVMPYVSVEARVYVSVNEKVTTGNVGSNGETSFHHVFMKMMPDGDGTTFSFTAAELQHLEFTQDLSSTFVEEMDDLEVSIWIQNYPSRFVYNSHFAYEYTDIHPYPVENLKLVQDPTADCICLTASWDAPMQGRPIGYNVYVNNELVAENTSETSYFFQGELYQFYVVGVEALYPDDKSSVRAVATVTENLQDMGLIIPGPSNVILDTETPLHNLSVQNANFGTMTPIQINSITEGASNGGPYLNIELSSELPAMVEAGEEFYFTISPITMGERSYASTSINVNYDGGVISFLVEIDGELLKVTELSSTAKVYPNPANNQMHIESAKSIESVKVYNMMGALVETIPANAKTVNVDLNAYSNGIYFFNIRQSDGTVSNQRIVVSH